MLSVTVSWHTTSKKRRIRRKELFNSHFSVDLVLLGLDPSEAHNKGQHPEGPTGGHHSHGLSKSEPDGLLASQGPSSAGSLAAKISISLHVGRAPDDQGLHNFSHVLVLGYIWRLFIKLNATSYVHSNLSHNALYNICKSLNTNTLRESPQSLA